MDEIKDPKGSLGAALIRQDRPSESDYEEYRMELETALKRAERRGRLAFHICWSSMLVAIGLSLVGASRVFGSFDPFDRSANLLTLVLGVIYVLACIAFPLSLASWYSRFRPRGHVIRQQIAEAKIDQLGRDIEAARKGRDD